jgi:YesN/AraC family two-component response regulator
MITGPCSQTFKLQDDLGAEFEIVGTAANGEEAVRAALYLDPDVVLDINMPLMNGLQTASSLR